MTPRFLPRLLSCLSRSHRVPALPSSAGLAALPLLALVTACGQSDPVLARGEQVFGTCAPCHGDDGAGNQSLGAPAIAGATEWYLKNQLEGFQAEPPRRGYHYQDAEGLRMRPMSRALWKEGDLDAVVAYVASLPMADPPAVGEGDAGAGEDDYTLLCANCHGTDGRGDRSLNAPGLLHLSDWYMTSSLRKYRDQVRGATPGDAFGATMRAPVTGFSDQRIDDVTAYVMTMRRLPRRPEREVAEVVLPAVEIDPALLPEGVTLEMAQEGQSIFHGAGICYTCHTQGGAGGPLAPDLTDDVWLNIDGSYDAVVDIIITGVPQPLEHPGPMMARAGVNLTDEQVRSVAAYVFTLSR